MKSVTSIRWGGDGLIYSGSQDRTIKMWRDSDVRSSFFYLYNFLNLQNLILQGVLCRTLQGHGHWINTLALSLDYVLRTGAYDAKHLMKPSPEYTPSKY